jgi:hypothetical protein
VQVSNALQRRQNIHLRGDFSYRFRMRWKPGKGLKSRLASWAVPKMANDLIVHEFRFTGSDNLVIAPNTLDPEHKHGASLLHRFVGVPILNAEDLPTNGLSCVTTSVARTGVLCRNQRDQI